MAAPRRGQTEAGRGGDPQVLGQYGRDGIKRRALRRRRIRHEEHVPIEIIAPSPAELDRAWAAGFIDGEGYFGLVHSHARKGGTDWYRIRVSVSQHGEIGEVPEVLLKLKRVLGGRGRIERHSGPDDFKWVVEGEEHVRAGLAVLSMLGPVKSAQALNALEGFAGQPRLKGDATHCVRGHEYTGQAMRGGRLRRVCSECARITGRQQRARSGIAPRQFKNETRRYTF